MSGRPGAAPAARWVAATVARALPRQADRERYYACSICRRERDTSIAAPIVG
jgi:hypothetical protein